MKHTAIPVTPTTDSRNIPKSPKFWTIWARVGGPPRGPGCARMPLRGSMWQIVHLIVRSLEILLGLFCVLTAILLYPGEEERIQTALQDVWVRVDDYQKFALSKHATFLTQVARLETGFLDWLFGPKLLSEKALAVSFSLSVGTFSLVFLRTWLWMADVIPAGVIVVLLLLGLTVGATVIGLASLLLQKRTVTRRIIIIIALVFTACWVNLFSLGVLRRSAGIFLGASALGGLICDFAFIALTRRLLGWVGTATSSSRVIAVVLATVALATILVSPLILYDFDLDFATFSLSLGSLGDLDAEDLLAMFAVVAALTNVFDAALSVLFIVLCLMLLVHRCTWPILTRSVFRMQEIGTKGRRGILTAVGLALLGSSAFGGKLHELFAKLVEKLGG